MKNIYSIIFITFIILGISFVSCNQYKTEKYETKIIHEIIIPILPNQNNLALKPKLITSDNSSYLSFIDVNNRLIRFWDIKNNRYSDTIGIGHYKYQFVQDYHYINDDSLILAFNTTYFMMNHDKCILITNRNKDVLGYFNFNKSPVRTSKSPRATDSIYYSDYTYVPLQLINNRVVASLAAYRNKYCDSVFYNGQESITGYLHADSKLSFQAIPIKFPCPGPDLFYPLDVKYLRACYGNNKIVYGFGHIPEMQIFDTKNETILTRTIPFQSVDSILPKRKLIPEFFDFTQGEYLDIIYNKSKNEYIRLARLAVEENDNTKIQNYPMHSFVTFNESFHKTGEGIIPFGHKDPIVPYRNGYLIYNKYRSDSLQKIVFSYVEYGYRKDNKELKEIIDLEKPKYNSSLKLKNQLSKISPAKEYIMVDLDNVCSSCLIKLNSFVKQNSREFKDKHIKILVLVSNESMYYAYLQKYSMQNYSGVLLFQANKFLFKPHLKSWRNIKHIIVDGEEIHEYEILAGGVDTFLKKLVE